MLQKKGFIVLTGIFFALVFGMFFSESAYADTVSDVLRGESVGASMVLNSTAYNEASLDKLGITIESEDELDANTLVMANVLSVLNVRSDASLDSKVVGKLYKDCGGVVLEHGEEWSLIESGDVIGWCKSDYLLFDEEAVEFAKEVGITNAIVNMNCITVRTEADDESDALGYATQNTIMEVISETEDGWVNVAYEDQDGFVRSDYVRIEFRIDHAESIEAIAARRKAEQEAKNKLKRQNEAIAADSDTLRLLASLIYCEARGESYEGMLAVGSVVMNRVRSQAYPNSVYDVIFASGQFSPAMSGSLQKAYVTGANSICYQAAQEVLDGYSNVGEMTHFRRKGSKEGFVIGNHVFY
ncbi:MAG: cell wall hydrolase [Lachnospiraceae bacterium]|nr:cell wall hydrolase [Lachnospiraceae bacterium]